MKYTCELRKGARTRRGRRIDRGRYMQVSTDRMVREVSPGFGHAVVHGKFDPSEEACYIVVQQVDMRRNTERYTSLDGPGRGLHSICIFPTMREAIQTEIESRGQRIDVRGADAQITENAYSGEWR
jgi:hypothetical protein